MTDINSLIAQGPGRVDFSPLGDIGKSYFEGLNAAYQQRNQNLFQNGVPADIDQAARQAIQAGGVPALEKFAPLFAGAEDQRKLAAIEGGTSPAVSPSSSRYVSIPAQDSAPRGAQTLNGLVLRATNGNEAAARPIVDSIAQEHGVEPDGLLDPKALSRVVPAIRQRFAQSSDNRGVANTVIDPDKERKIQQYTVLSGSQNKSVAAAAKARLEALQKQTEPTPLQKEYDLAKRQGFGGSMQDFEQQREADKTYAAENAKAQTKKYEQIQTAGERARVDLPQLEQARSLTEDPNFYSGVGEKYNLLLKRAVVALGGDANTAAPQEVFRKIVSNSIIDQIKGMSGTGAGPIRVAEINIMRQAAANPDNSPQANRMLIEIASRVQKRAADIADMAQQYRGGRLDQGFDRQIAVYDKRHPLFSPDEIANFRKVIDAGGKKTPAANPTLGATPDAVEAEMRRRGLLPK